MENTFVKISICGWLLLQSATAQFNPANYVNPMIGTGGHGHTFPGATVPFGMVQLSPDTRIDGSWDGCSGYHYGDTAMYGFSHTHLSGTGCSDYGDIAVLPLTGPAYEKFYKKKLPVGQYTNENKHYEKFSHDYERAMAGYYTVTLDNKVKAELTTTPRCGFHKYTWPVNQTRLLLIKIDHRDKTLLAHVNVSKDKKTISGYRTSQAWARKQYVFFSMEFSEEFEVIEIRNGERNEFERDEYKSETKRLIDTAPVSYLLIRFKKQKKQSPLLVKAGMSMVSEAGAGKNLAAEISHWDFEKTRTEAAALWNKELSKIEVTSTDENKLATFYTALYHCMIHPSIANDVDGNYRGRDNQEHHADHNYYTVFSLWDTFRGLHPLLTIIDRQRTNDFIKTFLLQYQQGGRLPVWELSSNETNCMIGYHSVSVMADAYLKGIKDFDINLALEAAQKSATWNHLGVPQYSKHGYLETDDEHESVSKTLEYSYDDWCIAQMANTAGQKEIAQTYYERSCGWKNLFDPTVTFIRPRNNGGWLNPYDAREVNNHYTEANGWQYTFFVPHDMNNLVLAMGGEKRFGQKLDSLFFGNAKTTGREQADITGQIGQYAHGNEPSHHMAYLYTYAAQPWRTQQLVHKICTEFYKNTPDGLIGNEDCGQMSAWYVLSMMGFYPVCPGSPEYVYGTPGFAKVIIHLENGKDFTITAKDWGGKNIYLKEVDYFYVQHENIASGGSLSFVMTDKPETHLINVEGYRVPKRSVENKHAWPAPVILARTRAFRDSMKVTVSRTGYRYSRINYKVWNPNDTAARRKAQWKEYSEPFYIDNDAEVRAVAMGPEKESRTISATTAAHYHKMDHNWTIELKSKYNLQYTGGGPEALIDGLRGDNDWRKGYWQGYQNQDFECIIDLQQEKTVSEIGAEFLQDSRAWILFPREVEFYGSKDGKEFFKIRGIAFNDDPLDPKVSHKSYTSSQGGSKYNLRYIKVVAKNFGKLPLGHEGFEYNESAFIFIDEIWVK